MSFLQNLRKLLTLDCSQSPETHPNQGQTFILEPILTPSGLGLDGDGGDETPLDPGLAIDLDPPDSDDIDLPDDTDTSEGEPPEATDKDNPDIGDIDAGEVAFDPETEEEVPYMTSLPTGEDADAEGDQPITEGDPLIQEPIEANDIEPDGEKQPLSAASAGSSEVGNTEVIQPRDEAQSPDAGGEILSNPEEKTGEIVPVLEITPPNFTFDSGIFTVGETGQVEIDYIFDGGGYKGELAIFSLEGMDEFEPGSEAFIQEAASRALSSSEQGYVVISDADEGARFSGNLGERDQNSGEYLGIKSFNMRSGDTFGVMLVPNKTVARVLDNPSIGGSGRPLFSMVTANPHEAFHVGQIADVTGDGSTFVMEDIRMDGKTDSDYNDIIFQIRGAKGKAALMDEVLAEGKDWRETELGKGIIEYVKPYVTPDSVDEVAGDLIEDIETLLEFLDTTEPETDEILGEENLGEEAFTADIDNLVEEVVTPDEGEASEGENRVEPEVVQQESDSTVIEDNSVDEGETSEGENRVEPAVENNSGEEEKPTEVTVAENNPVAEDEASTQVADREENQPVEEKEAVVAETTETENEESSDDFEENAVEEQESVEAVEGENTETAWVEPEPTVKEKLVERLETLAVNLEEIDTEENSITELKATITKLTESLTQNSEDLSEVQEVATTRLVNRLEAVAQQWVSRGEEPVQLEFAQTAQPLVGIIDTGFSGDNPDIDYARITLGTDYVGGDDNPLLSEGEGNEHGTHILGTIGATQNNGIGIDGINDQAPLWVGRAVGSGKWAESLREFVNAAKESGQPNAVVNLSMDLTQIDTEGNVTTRYELTPDEREAIEYARQNNVLIVAAAGNDGGVMSALGQASQEFDNILTVGAAEKLNGETSVWKGFDRAEYSSYGQGLDIMAPGGTIDNPELSLTGDSVGTMAGTSVATAKVTGAVSQVWAANPKLSYRQVMEIVKNTATDLKDTGWDVASGAGLLNMMAAVELAKVTKPQEYDVLPTVIPDTWSGEGIFTPGERAVGIEYGTYNPNVSSAFLNKVKTIGKNLGLAPEYLMAVMGFETGGTYSPSIQNSLSGATGLIQFMPTTAQGLGTSVSALAQMTAIQQLDYVEKYLNPYKGRFSTLEDAYMAVLWPAAVGKGPNYTLFRSGTIQYSQNSGLDLNRDGIVTAREAANKVRQYLPPASLFGSPPNNSGSTIGSIPESWQMSSSAKGVGQVAVGRNQDGRLEAFVIGSDNKVYQSWQTTANGNWSAWQQLSGGTAKSLTVSRNQDGRLEVFAIGTDNKVYQAWQKTPNGSWSNWQQLSGGSAKDLVVGQNQDGRLEAFVVGTDNKIYQAWQKTPNGSWSNWQQLSGGSGKSLTVGRNQDGRLEVFAIGTDDKVYRAWQTTPNGGWSNWQQLSGGSAKDLVVGQNQDGRLEAFVVGTDDKVYQAWQKTPNGSWSNWQQLSGGSGKSLTVGRNQDGRLEVFVVGTDDKVYQAWQKTPNGSWSNWQPLLQSGSVSGLTVSQNQDGRLEVFAMSMSGSLQQAWQNKPNSSWIGWHSRNLPNSTISTSPPGQPGQKRIIDAVNKVNPDQAYYLPHNIDVNPGNETFCNWFAADVLECLGVPIPRQTTSPYKMNPPVFGGANRDKPISAEELNTFFKNGGGVYDRKNYGKWQKVSAADAAAKANNGQAVVASSYGHIAIVIPGGSASNVRIAQAGAKNGKNMSVSTGFGSITPSYFAYVG